MKREQNGTGEIMISMLKGYNKRYLINDIIAGIIVALISIPISMGYAQVAGLPVVYGLYGSVLPVVVFAFTTSSPQFVFGVDAAPAALVGATLATLGVTSGSDEAIRLVPAITVVTALWLLLFYILKAGRLVNYISKPVLGGFISGIGVTIILMQTAKLFGGSAATGEVFELLAHIVGELKNFNVASVIMGAGTLTIILVCKKIIPKVPMSVVMLFLGALSQVFLKVDRWGVKLLPKVEPGFSEFILPDMSAILTDPAEIIVLGFTVALVIVASTLLTASNYALKYDYKINNNREILAYALSNMMAALVGGCPLNGSVSRTGISVSFKCKTQVSSLVAALTMTLILLFGTEFIAYLPVPVLTAIVIAALIGILEFGMAAKLWKTDKSEFMIFAGAFAGVLIFGTLYGVIIGVVLSFVAVIRRATVPPRTYLGVIPGRTEFHNLNRNKNAHEIEGVLLYRFSGSLFFANIDVFINDIEKGICEDTKCVIVDASGIGSIDITAADRLIMIADKLKKQGIRFYITEHVENVNDELNKLGAGKLITGGVIRRTITLALRDAGIEAPYILKDKNGVSAENTILEPNDKLAEFEWAFGAAAEEQMEKLTMEVAAQMKELGFEDDEALLHAEQHISWGRLGLFDEDELLDRLEMHLSEIAHGNIHDEKLLEERIEKRRLIIEKKLSALNPDAINALRKHRHNLELRFSRRNPKAYEHMLLIRRQHIEDLEKTNPELADKLKRHYDWKE